jgi:23S rRNA (uridine2552-2'-O)-methyltransferase
MISGAGMSSNRWLSRQANDPYVRRARERGYRARAAFKLIELDDKHRFLRPGRRVVDLGAAPGSWSQVAAERVGEQGRVVATDVLEIEPMPGVEIVRGDFRDNDVLAQLERTVGGCVDLVLSDMAPNISGVAASDQARSMDLAELALAFASDWLEPDGVFVVKLFQGEGFDEFVARAREAFAAVKLRKPGASRKQSREIYLVADSRRAM